MNLTLAETQSNHTRVKWAEGLILQLPEDHEGRNSWLLNYGTGVEAMNFRYPKRLLWSKETESAVEATDLNKAQGHKLQVPVKFKGLDDWNRPIYKQIGKNLYFGSTNILFPDVKLAPNGEPKEINAYFRENLEYLEYFGSHFDCEPIGGFPDFYQLVIID